MHRIGLTVGQIMLLMLPSEPELQSSWITFISLPSTPVLQFYLRITIPTTTIEIDLEIHHNQVQTKSDPSLIPD